MTQEPTFMDFVQLHERKWGETQYPGRPALADLIKAPIVALWVYRGRFMFTVHQQANELNALVQGAVLADKAGVAKPWKLAKIFVNQQEIEFEVRIVTPAKEAQKPLPKVNEQPSKRSSDLVPLNNPPEVVPLNRQPDMVPFRPRIASRRPEFVTPYVDDYDRLAAAGRVIRSYMPIEMKPGRNPKHLKRSDGRRTP